MNEAAPAGGRAVNDAVRRLRARLAGDYPLRDLTVTIAGRAWTLTTARDQDSLLDQVQTDADLERFPYGLLLWASAVGLAECLAEQPELVAGRRVLEIGAGVGLPGLVARSLGADVTQTDYQQAALTLTRLNAAQNDLEAIRFLLADWRDYHDPARYDLVLGSDVLYERALHRDVARLLSRALAPGGMALISDPIRPQAMEFADRLEQQGQRVELESRQVDWPEDPREIVLFRLSGFSGARA